jgi:hypothetical protein
MEQKHNMAKTNGNPGMSSNLRLNKKITPTIIPTNIIPTNIIPTNIGNIIFGLKYFLQSIFFILHKPITYTSLLQKCQGTIAHNVPAAYDGWRPG